MCHGSRYRASALLTDLRYAVRLLARSPLFTLTSMLSFAIGIAASTIVFGAADALFFRASPGVREAARLVDLARTSDGSGYGPILYPVFRHVRARRAGSTDPAAASRAQ